MNLREELDQMHNVLEDIWLDYSQEANLDTVNYFQGLYNSADLHYGRGQFDRAQDFINSFWRALNERA